MNKALWLLVLSGGCIEYQPASTLPPAGVPNAAPIESPTQTDRLVQVQVPEVDVLWVIDNSGSMGDNQAALTANFPVFMDFFLGSGLDYHIGAVSTDMNNSNDSGKLSEVAGYRWIDEDTPNPSDIFTGLALFGTSGASTERGRDAAYMAVEVEAQPNRYNDGFIRPDATLNIVAISDEEDQSFEISRPEFINYLQTVKISPDMVTFSSIVSPNPVCPDAFSAGDNYVAVTNQVGGIFWSICNQDWVTVLEQLGIQATGLKREYFLSQLPVPGSIKVWVVDDGSTFEFAEDVDWVYDPPRNSIVFNSYVPGALAEVFVEYDLLSATEG